MKFLNCQRLLGAAVVVVSGIAGLAISSEAEARRHHGFHCPHGQIYRVSMGTCEGRGRYARYAMREEPPPPKPKREPRHRHKPQMLEVIEPPKSPEPLPPEEPVRETKGDRCGDTDKVLLPNVPWYSAERSLMTIKPMGDMRWIVR
jgi:hypothetical protein